MLRCNSNVTGSRPVGREDVEGRRLLAGLEGLLQRDGQRLAVEELLVLNSGTPESLSHGDVLEGHWGKEGEKGDDRGGDESQCYFCGNAR